MNTDMVVFLAVFIPILTAVIIFALRHRGDRDRVPARRRFTRGGGASPIGMYGHGTTTGDSSGGHGDGGGWGGGGIGGGGT